MDISSLEHLTMRTWRMAGYATLNLIGNATMLAIFY